ncbi:MAG: hypothetical protein HF982_03340 [Desulfobacteraceae bacterium]|nr:hypothetical protein [Desulfobacteraceae bacterium]MBC2718619.1 hypothetical protein [Desulfobacteraceae bacterium]
MKRLSEEEVISCILGILTRFLEIPEKYVTFKKARVVTTDRNSVNVQSL